MRRDDGYDDEDDNDDDDDDDECDNYGYDGDDYVIMMYY